MLEAHGQGVDFLESPSSETFVNVPTLDQPLSEGPGTQIGRYKLLQQIGEGGRGRVWMAEQTEPVRRRVAFKIIKPGMDTQEVVARFEAERQALAMMDHPNIAKVLDAGTTGGGKGSGSRICANSFVRRPPEGPFRQMSPDPFADTALIPQRTSPTANRASPAHKPPIASLEGLASLSHQRPCRHCCLFTQPPLPKRER